MPSWRDHFKIHPAADLFPLMNEADLRDLGESIKGHGGLIQPVHLYKGDLLDGRSRLDAMELVGFRFDRTGLSSISHDLSDFIDPYAHVIAANIHRRHLTSEQKNNLILAVLKLRPDQSNRQIGADLKVDHKKVAAVRRTGEATGEISPVQKTVGKDGKARPTKVKKKKPDSAEIPTGVPTEPVHGAEPEVELKTVEDAEAEISRLKQLKAKLKGVTEDKFSALASAKALAEFKTACGIWLTKMNADDLQAAIDYFAEAVEVPANELMPDVKKAQFDLKIAKAQITKLKRELAGKLPPRESRANAWQRLADEAAANIEQLIEYQGEFESAQSAQPDSLQDGPFAQRCEEICGIDLESALSTLQEAVDAEPPRGFGRD